VKLAYQDAAEEVRIVTQETASADELLVWRAVTVTRATRVNPKFKKGASVRAAIAMVAITERLVLAGVAADDALRQAAAAALTTRTELKDELGADLGATIDEILAALAGLELARLQALADQASSASPASPKV